MCPTWSSGLTTVHAQSTKLLFSGSILGIYAPPLSSTYKHKLFRACSYTKPCVCFFKPVRPMCFCFGQSQPPLRRRQWHPTPVLLPGKSHGWRSLVDCNPWGHKELDTTGRLHFHFSLSCIGEGNGNPLQCSCLENLRDEGTWWAAIYGVAQSWTWLTRLSSSSSNVDVFWSRGYEQEELNSAGFLLNADSYYSVQAVLRC